MTNTISKGLRAQRKVKEYLLKDKDIKLIYFIHHSRWSKDIFGLFDGFYIKEGEVCFFQVKSNRKPLLEPYKEFYEKYKIPCKVFVVKDRKEIKEINPC